ncbi:hypothetical protein LF887_06300 [Chryseobacterium sp. MEBOG06]|uniref:hypothetical protein n=1 Tax=unclassified Chryseobacterium TaxID=2593645 RepID=UPI001F48982A|nr:MULTISPECIES: hypothetical protein [unclassified Chryseobacterium]UKB85234.1 hypothetical protein LF887_06300 [Chryseobacterium sp. MEBOG06]
MREISDKLIRNDNAINPHTSALNSIQTTTSRKIFFDPDIDFKTDDHQNAVNRFRSDIESIVNADCLVFIKTHGGFHCLIKTESKENK